MARSRWFQRFAVWSHTKIKDAGKVSAQRGAVLDEHISKFTEVAKEKSAQFRKDFAEEMRKAQQQQGKK